MAYMQKPMAMIAALDFIVRSAVAGNHHSLAIRFDVTDL